MAPALSHFWNPQKPIRSIFKTLSAAMVAWIIAKIVRTLIWAKKMQSLGFPGPAYHFPMGNMKEMDEHGGFALEFFKAMHKKHGPIFGFFMPMGDYHLSTDRPEVLQQVHKKAPERPDSTFKVVNYLFKENVLFQHGEWQKTLRRSYQSIIDDPDVRTRLQQCAWDSLNKEIADWPAKKKVDIHGKFEPMVYDIMGQVLFGQSWSGSDIGRKIKEDHLHCVHNVMKYAFLPFKPLAGELRKGWEEYEKHKKGFWDKINGLLAQRRQDLKSKKVSSSNKDVFTLLLQATKPNSKELLYDNNTAVATMCVFLNGAFDTTLNSTSWTLYWLAKHPKCQQKLQAEIDAAFPDLKNATTPPSPDVLKDLQYMDAVLRESMRVLPAAPINMRVNMDSDYTVTCDGKDYVIPKDVTMICPYECSMMQEDVFGEGCDDFNPERFMGDDDKIRERRSMWTPFGDHKRMCVGRNFALDEIRLFLARIMSKFTLSLEDPNQKIGVKYEAGINVINPQPVFVIKER